MAEGSVAATASIELTEEDIPGAALNEPMVKHTIPELLWWLLCRGIKAPASWKEKLVARIQEAYSQQLPVIDVDGSYVYKKQQRLTGHAANLLLSPPSIPMSGWHIVDENNISSISNSMPVVTSGLLYTYLACGVGQSDMQGAFRAQTRGYKHWASGHLDQVKINTMHPNYCHVCCTCIPSMKPGKYQVYVLLSQEDDAASINTATCECAAGHLHTCFGIVACTCGNDNRELSSDHDSAMPVTSYLCQWKVPKKREESIVPMSAAVFEKHDYQKAKKRKATSTEDFDPRPTEYRGIAPSLLPALLEDVHGESLGVSLLFDSKYCHQALPYTDTDIPDLSAIKRNVVAFKDSLRVSSANRAEYERSKRFKLLFFSSSL